MIYVSSACVRNKLISDSVKELSELGYGNIELSGGTQPYPNLQADLLDLKSKGTSFLLHNYFPPPETPFVLNLASLDEETEMLSMQHARAALQLSEKLGCSKFGIHAGFLINIPVNQIGKSIDQKTLFNRDEAMEKFVSNIRQLQTEFTTQIFIENNVIAPFNLSNFKGENPFFLTSSKDLEEMANQFDLNLLLDVAHLKVSCTALNLNFEKELEAMLPISRYIHISDNDGQADSNNAMKQDSALYHSLSKFDLKDKTITIEVYDGNQAILETHNAILSLL